jgi:hypothetical protein
VRSALRGDAGGLRDLPGVDVLLEAHDLAVADAVAFTVPR